MGNCHSLAAVQIGDDARISRDLDQGVFAGLIVETWPATPDEMDRLLGFRGERIPDTQNTLGRNKVVWRTCGAIKITFEQHPYHVNAPTWHRGPHWHLDTPGKPHQRFLPGEPIAGL